MTGEQLKGFAIFVKLRDGRRVRLELDFNATMAYERDFDLPQQQKMNELSERLTVDGEPPTSTQLFDYCERQGIPTSICRAESVARWAYCLTESWREENPADQMDFKRFRRILPFGPAMAAWTGAVTKCLSSLSPEDEKKSAPGVTDSPTSVDVVPIGPPSSGGLP